MTAHPDTPPALTETPSGYADWLAELKACIHPAQQRATLAVKFVQGVLAQLRSSADGALSG